MPEQQTRLLAERYELIAPLGRGTMGTVWRARDRALGREVAVKEIRQDPGLTEEQRAELRERMVREGRIAARINHPSVAAIHDVLIHDNSPWIIMELIEARSLEQVIDEEGPLPPRLVAEIGVDLLGALRAAHAQGITHRDVKPGNVLITETGRVVLTDFGIAKAEGDSRLTKTGMVIGSPGYTAPERARGEYTGPESDVWSLGATLYFAVEGRPAYERATIAETLAALLSENADPPTQAGSLRPVLTGLLDKDHRRRMTAAKAETLLRMVADTPTNEMPAITAEALIAQEAGVPDSNDTSPAVQAPRTAAPWGTPPAAPGRGAQGGPSGPGRDAQAPHAAGGPSGAGGPTGPALAGAGGPAGQRGPASQGGQAGRGGQSGRGGQAAQSGSAAAGGQAGQSGSAGPGGQTDQGWQAAQSGQTAQGGQARGGQGPMGGPQGPVSGPQGRGTGSRPNAPSTSPQGPATGPQAARAGAASDVWTARPTGGVQPHGPSGAPSGPAGAAQGPAGTPRGAVGAPQGPGGGPQGPGGGSQGPGGGPQGPGGGPRGAGRGGPTGPRPSGAYDPEQTISVARPKAPIPQDPSRRGSDEESTVTTRIHQAPGQQVYPLPPPQQNPQPGPRGPQPGPRGPQPGPQQAPPPIGQERQAGQGLGTDLFAIAKEPEQGPTGNRNGMLVLMAVAAAAAVVIAVLIVALLSS
ncbi:serine/threonine-protein kinase [Nonomuraea sp. NEAU-A123]|uniref:serine/threonine-protein kinase n=1 Tax=Nonomuraea sp. NEAU-A123 TaxID=2839649 RepID=UPI001BE4101A|nr:serine/threonine-protein kinase [Nonomuraea sp. NEAU-A123]MBT2230853.1 protein kinase [Nonomuraea sp. NEAU-A123]